MRGYHRRRGWLAWHTAGLGRIKDFPDLHQLTGDRPARSRVMSGDEIARNMAMFAEAHNAALAAAGESFLDDAATNAASGVMPGGLEP